MPLQCCSCDSELTLFDGNRICAVSFTFILFSDADSWLGYAARVIIDGDFQTILKTRPWPILRCFLRFLLENEEYESFLSR
jgi:hypothetical protein